MMMSLFAALRGPKQNALGLVLLRLAAGTIFIYHGWPKLASPETVVPFFERIGIPMANLMVPFVGVVEVVGGAFLILGLLTQLVGLALAIDMIVAILAAKGLTSWRAIEFEVILLAVSVLFLFHGAGSWSVDQKIMRRR